MSFAEPYSDVIICNGSLSLLKESPIASMEQGGSAARECRTWYKKTVRWLLEEHAWGLATKRSPLAALATNDRTAEWLYAYAAPRDLAFPVDIIPLNGSGAIGYYQGLKQFTLPQQRFKREGSVIYSRVPGAYLAHTSLDVTEADFSEQFVITIQFYLASRMAIGLRGSEKMRDRYAADGLTALQNAKAKNLNEQRQTYGDAISDTERSRAGGSEYGGGYVYPVLGTRLIY